jgi:hypothetical protein
MAKAVAYVDKETQGGFASNDELSKYDITRFSDHQTDSLLHSPDSPTYMTAELVA